MSEEKEWHFIASDGKEYGPYAAEQLRGYAADGTIIPETLVWTGSLEEWIPARGVEGLFPTPVATPAAGPVFLTGATPLRKVATGLHQPLAVPTIEVDKGFVTVAWGIRLVFWGFLISLLATLAIVVLESGEAPSAQGMTTLFTLVAAGGFLAEVVGMSLCFCRPRDPLARGLLTAALALMLMPILLGFINLALAVVYGIIMQGVGELLTMLLFVLYLKKTVSLLGNRGLELRARSFATFLSVLLGMIFLGWILLVVMLGAQISNPYLRGFSGNIGIFLLGGVVLLVMYIVAVCRYLRLLQDVRREVLLQWARSGSHGTPGPEAQQESGGPGC